MGLDLPADNVFSPTEKRHALLFSVGENTSIGTRDSVT